MKKRAITLVLIPEYALKDATCMHGVKREREIGNKFGIK